MFAAVAVRGLAAFGAERLDAVALAPEAGFRRDVGDQLVGVVCITSAKMRRNEVGAMPATRVFSRTGVNPKVSYNDSVLYF